MSRAYRIKVCESQDRVVKAKDHVSTQLEILNVLPPETIAPTFSERLQSLAGTAPGRCYLAGIHLHRGDEPRRLGHQLLHQLEAGAAGHAEVGDDDRRRLAGRFPAWRNASGTR